MNVSGLIEFFDGKIDGSLMDAVSSNDGDGLAEREEARVCRFPEANIVGAESPTHGSRTTLDAQREKAVEQRVIETRGVIGDGQERARGAGPDLGWPKGCCIRQVLHVSGGK